MIVLRTIFFLLSLVMTLFFLEDAIEQIMLNSKKSEPTLHAFYTGEYMGIFSGTLMFLMVLFWTVFYLLYQF